MNKSSIRVGEETRELVNGIKQKFKLSSNDETINLCCLFFKNNDVSPKDLIKPTEVLIKELRNTFVTFFRKSENDMMLPFIKDSYLFQKKMLEILNAPEGEDINAKPQILEQKTNNETSLDIKSNLNNDEIFELKNYFLELDKMKNNNQNNIYFQMPVYNQYMDKN